jgi:hypothetical protein
MTNFIYFVCYCVRQCSGCSTEGSFLCGHIIVYLYLTTVDVLFPNWTPFITYSCAPFFFYFLWNLFFCFHKLILFEVPFQFFVLDSQCRTKWHMVYKYFRSSSIFLLKINQYDKAEHYLRLSVKMWISFLGSISCAIYILEITSTLNLVWSIIQHLDK